MGRATFVTLDMLSALHVAEIEAGLRGDLDAAGLQFDRGEALTRAAVAQTPATPVEAIELLRIARWLAGFGECAEAGETLAQALATIAAEGLSGRALHFVRRAGEFAHADPCLEQALQSFWRGASARRVEAAQSADVSALGVD